jgi:hypothetical protein
MEGFYLDAQTIVFFFPFVSSRAIGRTDLSRDTYIERRACAFGAVGRYGRGAGGV